MTDPFLPWINPHGRRASRRQCCALTLPSAIEHLYGRSFETIAWKVTPARQLTVCLGLVEPAALLGGQLEVDGCEALFQLSHG